MINFSLKHDCLVKKLCCKNYVIEKMHDKSQKEVWMGAADLAALCVIIHSAHTGLNSGWVKERGCICYENK